MRELNVVIFKEIDIKNGIIHPEEKTFSDVKQLTDFLNENGPCEIGIWLPMLLFVNPALLGKDFYMVILEQ